MTARRLPRALMVYMEPAPYIAALVEQIRRAASCADVLYVGAALTQAWREPVVDARTAMLPHGLWAAVSEIRGRLASGRYDVLHLAGWGHPLLLAALLVGRWLRVPVTVESDTPAGAPGATWKRAAKRIAYPWLFRLPSRFLPGGTPQAAYVRGYGVPDSRIRVAMMTVDVAHIRSMVGGFGPVERAAALRRLRLAPGAVRFLYVGRLEPYKGVGDLLAAFGRLRGGLDTALMIAGDGSMREAVAAAAADPRIRYLGRIEGDALWETFALADVLVLPSRSEAWGLVVNEAMAAGLPVIVTDRAGCVPDLVDDNGLVVRAEDPDTLRDAMRRLAEDATLRQTMGRAATARIAGWTLANQAARTIAAWDEAVQCAR